MNVAIGRNTPYSHSILDGVSDNDSLDKMDLAISLIMRRENGFTNDDELLDWMDEALNLLGDESVFRNKDIENLKSIVAGNSDNDIIFNVFKTMSSSVLNLKSDDLLNDENCKLSNSAITQWVKKLEIPYEVQ